jgi:hypothetical protein
MRLRSAFLGVCTTAAVLALMPLGCGGAQEEYTVIERPRTEATTDPGRNELPPEIRQQVRACFGKHVGPWSQPKVSLRYGAKADPTGKLFEVALQETTLHDEEMVQCVRQAIAAMTISEQVLRARRSGPVSGGERMTREQRGSLGSNESQNPIVWGLYIVLEAVEFDVVVQVFVGAIAADPTDNCLDKYVACMDSLLGNLQVDKRGTTVCATCKSRCEEDGVWPSGFKATHHWQTCR